MPYSFLSNSIDLPAALSELRTDHVFVLEQELGNVKQSLLSMERLCAAMSGTNLHFSPPDGRSTPYDRQDFVALACRVNVLFKYACARQAARASS